MRWLTFLFNNSFASNDETQLSSNTFATICLLASCECVQVQLVGTHNTYELSFLYFIFPTLSSHSLALFRTCSRIKQLCYYRLTVNSLSLSLSLPLALFVSLRSMLGYAAATPSVKSFRQASNTQYSH